MTRRLPLALLLALAPPAAAQSGAAIEAHQVSERGTDAFLQAEKARAAGAPEAASHYTTALEAFREAQRLLRTDLHRYRLLEALSHRGLGRLGDAWAILRELAAQTDAPPIAHKAREALEDINAHLGERQHALLFLDCGGTGLELRVDPRPATAATASHPALGQWMRCEIWRESHALPAAAYTLTVRSHPGSDQIVRDITLRAGDRHRVAVHHMVAPTPALNPDTGCATNRR